MKVKVMEKDDIKEAAMKMVEAQGTKFLMAKVEGKLYAMDGICSHRGGELWTGKLTGFVVKCPKHGSEYDVRTGAVVGQVKIPLIGKAKNLRSYPVTVGPDGIFVEV